MNQYALITFATDNYSNCRKRWVETMNEFKPDNVDVFCNTDYGTILSPTHQENPYAFKVSSFIWARALGYKKILWLDSSCFAIKPLQPLFDIIDNEGSLMQYAGHMCGTWANDNCLKHFNMNRDEAMQKPMYGNSGMLGLNFENDLARQFFEEWQQAMEHGAFKGGWTNEGNVESNDFRCKGHRHDMVCGSIIATRLGMPYKAGDQILQYGSPEEPTINDSIIIKAQGIN